MRIELAQSARFEQVMAFYNYMVDVTENTPSSPRWERDVHPTRDEIAASIAAGQIAVVYDESLDGGVAAVMRCAREDLPVPEKYVHWLVNAAPDQIATVSLLAVHPEAQGRGLAKKMIAYAIERFRAEGVRALRLDCLATNFQAAGLYEGLGFARCGEGPFHPLTIGETMFFAYELAL